MASSNIYRGFTVTQTKSGGWEWADEQGRIHTGKTDTAGGYKSDEDCYAAIDTYKRELARKSA